MLPEKIPGPEASLEDVCRWAMKWKIAPELAGKLWRGAQELPYAITIISGHRSEEQQNALRAQGRPTADNDKSTHLSCPATGADVYPSIAVVPTVKAAIGVAMSRQGLRWGGGSKVDPDTGIPSDWNHFDLGPRVR